MNPLFFAMGKTAPEPDYEFPLNGEGDTAVYVLARMSGPEEKQWKNLLLL